MEQKGQNLTSSTVQDETSRSDPNAPNDENFGREVYFCNKRSIVKYYTRRSHLLETIHSQFKVREENRSTVVILQALGGNLVSTQVWLLLTVVRARQVTACYRLLLPELETKKIPRRGFPECVIGTNIKGRVHISY